jgi:hypothetical protein
MLCSRSLSRAPCSHIVPLTGALIMLLARNFKTLYLATVLLLLPVKCRLNPLNKIPQILMHYFSMHGLLDSGVLWSFVMIALTPLR